MPFRQAGSGVKFHFPGTQPGRACRKTCRKHCHELVAKINPVPRADSLLNSLPISFSITQLMLGYSFITENFRLFQDKPGLPQNSCRRVMEAHGLA